MVHLLRAKATADQLAEMLETLGVYIKLAVDIEEEIAAGGGALHADCEAVLSAQDPAVRARVKKVVESLLGGV